MPSVLRFIPRLILGMRKKATRDTRPPALRVSAPLPPDPERLARFRTAISDTHDSVPPTWPAATMTPLLVALVSDRRFPFPAVGLVHRAEHITVHKPLPAQQTLQLDARLTEARPCPAGVGFDIVCEGAVEDEVIWTSRSEIVWRAPGPKPAKPPQPIPTVPEDATTVQVDLKAARAYAAASQNRDPIHTMPRLARALGMPGVVMHGLWTLARAVALHSRPDTPYELHARFRKPVVVPATLHFSCDEHSPEKPFVVQTDDGAVRVTGSLKTSENERNGGSQQPV